MQSWEPCFSRAATSAARFTTDSSVDNTRALDDAVGNLIRTFNSVNPTARLSVSNGMVAEYLSYCPTIIASNHTGAATRSRFFRLLFNFGVYNVPIRRYMVNELELCGPVFQGLVYSIREELGPQNMVDILRLLQVLTYEKCLCLGIWANDLISFLMTEISRDTESEFMPYCIAILCNLSSRSKSVCSRIKKSSSYKAFTKRLVKLLSHDARIVVVSSLVLIGYLEEKIRDMVFCAQNIHETFQCVFNVLIMGDGDCLMTRHIAADLVKRLVVSEAPSVSSVPVITTTGKDIMNYKFFAKSVQQTAELLVTLDPRVQESMKVYEVLLAFCSLPQLRSATCAPIVALQPTDARLTTPLHACLTTASLSFDDAIDPMVPIRSTILVTHLLREIVDSNQAMLQFTSCDNIARVVSACVKSEIDTTSSLVHYQCKRIAVGLRLAAVCAGDDDVRASVLGVVTANLCAHLAEMQLLTNPIVLYMSKPPSQRTEVPSWSIDGVALVLELMRLLADLKDYSKMHKDQYWKSLKDERLIPFIAYAISHGNHELVNEALVLYTHCAQLQSFPSRLLGDLVASCAGSAVRSNEGLNGSADSTLNNSKDHRRTPTIDDVLPVPMDTSPIRDTALVDQLLKKMKAGVDIKDVKFSDLLATYERKIAVMKARENELEQLVRQSERVRQQTKNGQLNAGPTDAELTKIRSLVSDCESLRDENRKLREEMDEKDKSSTLMIHALRTELERTKQERDDYMSEISQERELVVSAKKHAEDLRNKLEIASNAIAAKNSDIAMLDKEKATLSSALSKVKSDLSVLAAKHEIEVRRLSEECDRWKKTNESINKELRLCENRMLLKDDQCRQLEESLNSLNLRYQDKQKECDVQANELATLRNSSKETQTKLEKMRRLKEEMLSLAGQYD